MEFSQYDMEYLVSQYEMMMQVYEHPESVGRERIEKMKVAFDSFDKDGNGVLDRSEVEDLLKMHFKETGINKKPTQGDVTEFFNKLDKELNSTINFEEFVHFMLHNMKQQLIMPLHNYLVGEGFNLPKPATVFSWDQQL